MVVQTQMCHHQSDEVNDIDFKDYKFSVAKIYQSLHLSKLRLYSEQPNSAYPARLKDFRQCIISSIMSIKYKVEGYDGLLEIVIQPIKNTNVTEYQLYMQRRESR